MCLNNIILPSSLRAFKNANVASAFAIEKAQKEELLGYKAGDGEVRQRKKTDKSSLLKVSSGNLYSYIYTSF